MDKTNVPQSDGPVAVDRRKLLAAAAAMTAASTIPKVTAANVVPGSVNPQPCRP
jgi:hypothetical protein